MKVFQTTLNGLNYEIYSDLTAIITASPKASGDIVIPESITYQKRKYLIKSISPKSLSHNMNINVITFEEGSQIEIIDQDAFSESSLSSISIPQHLTKIGAKAFFSCKQLETIIFSDFSELEIIDTAAFSMSSLTNIEIPSHVRQIGANAFSRCSSLATVSLYNNSELLSINDGAFSFCSQLQSIYIPPHVQNIGSSAFSYCNYLKTITFDQKSEIMTMNFGVFSMTQLENISIPESLIDLGRYFKGCNQIKSLELYSTEIVVDDRIIKNAPMLKELILPNATIVTIQKGCGKFNIYLRRNIRLSGSGINEHNIDYVDRLKRPSSMMFTSKRQENAKSSPIKTIASKKVTLVNPGTKKKANSSLICSKPTPTFPETEPKSCDDSSIQYLKSKISDLEKELKAKSVKIHELQSELSDERSAHKEAIKKLKIAAKNDPKNRNSVAIKDIQVLNLNDINQYQRVKKLGKGASSEVIKVTKPETYALKILNMEVFQKETKSKKSKKIDDFSDYDNEEEEEEIELDFDKIKRFFKEFELLNQLYHPNVIKTFGFFYGDRRHSPSILLEYCPYNLKDCIKKKRTSDEGIVRIIVEITNAMKYIHEHEIIHRDLKPENILLTSTKRVKLSDFGISKLITTETQSESSYTHGVGTLQFMAPELLRNKGKYNEKVDVYAFGVVLFFVLTEGDMPKISVVDVGNGLMAKIPKTVNKISQNLIKKCWAFNPRDRPSFDQIHEYIADNHYQLIEGVNEREILNDLKY